MGCYIVPNPLIRGVITRWAHDINGLGHGFVRELDGSGVLSAYGYIFSARDIYRDSLPYMAIDLPVTFEEASQSSGATRIAIDFTRVNRGLVDSFNGRRGFIYDEENDDEIYFEAKSVLNQSKPIVSGKTRVLYFPDPADDAKALFVYSESESSYISSLKMQGLPRLQHAYPSPTSEPEEDPFDLQAAYAASVDYLAQRHGKTLVNNKPALSRANTITASSGSKSSVPPPLPPNKPTHAPGQPNAKVQAEAARLAAIAREREERQNYGAPIEVAYCKLTKTQSAPELSGSAAASQIEEPIRRSTSWASFRPTQRRKYKFNPGNDDPFAGSEGFENLPPPTLHRRKKHDKVQQHQAEQVEIKHVENIYAPTEKTSFVQLPTIIEQPSYFDYSVPQRCETPTVEGMKRSLISQFPKPAPKFRLADRRRGKDLKNHILQLFPE